MKPLKLRHTLLISLLLIFFSGGCSLFFGPYSNWHNGEYRIDVRDPQSVWVFSTRLAEITGCPVSPVAVPKGFNLMEALRMCSALKMELERIEDGGLLVVCKPTGVITSPR